MRDAFFRFVLELVQWWAGILGLFRRSEPLSSVKVAVLEPCPTSSESVGDQALIAGLCRFLTEMPDVKVEIISFYDGYCGTVPTRTTYGGSLYRRGDHPIRKLLRYFKWPSQLQRYREFYVIGADLVDDKVYGCANPGNIL